MSYGFLFFGGLDETYYEDDTDFFKMSADTSKVTDYKYIRKIDFGSVAV